MAVLLALASSAVFGVADFLGGLSARRVAPLITAGASQVVGLVLLAVAASAAGGSLGGSDVGFAVAAGLVGGSSLWCFYFGLSRGAMSVVAPLSAVTAAVVPIVVGLALGDEPVLVQWVGIALALPAVVLVSRDEPSTEPDLLDPRHAVEVPPDEAASREGNRLGVAAGLLAGAGFGLFLVFITRTSTTSGLWPLVVSRGSSAVILVTAALLTRAALGAPRTAAARRGLALAGAAGVLDGSANVLVLEAGRRGMLVLVGVVASFYPAATILLARVVLRERLQRTQLVGLGLCVVAVVLIALR